MNIMLGVAVMFLLVAGLCGGLVAIGYGFAECVQASDREDMERQRHQLDAEWQALDSTRRLRAAFLDARLQMADEARLHGMRSTPRAGD